MEDFGRYKDVDGDGVPYRTLPGSEWLQSYTVELVDKYGVYSEKPHVYRPNGAFEEKNKWHKRPLVAPIIREEPECEIGVIYFGSMENSIQEIDDIVESKGYEMSQLRVRHYLYTTTSRNSFANIST